MTPAATVKISHPPGGDGAADAPGNVLVALLDVHGTILERTTAAKPAPKDSIPVWSTDDVGRPVWETACFVHDADVADAIRNAIASAADGGVMRLEVPVPVEQDEPHTFDVSVAPVAAGDGRVRHLVFSAVDMTDRVRLEQRQEMLLDELKHRVRNTVTIIRAIASQTLRNSGSLQVFRRSFERRLRSLARTHSVLTDVSWGDTDLGNLVRHQLEPYGDAGIDFMLSGPPVAAGSKSAVTLGLVFHELAANAAAYGALSQRGGRVDVSWTVECRDGRRVVVVTWGETGGPRVVAPRDFGFGSRLVQFNVVHEFDGEVDLDWRPEGLVCRIVLPIPSHRRVL